jgi:hypothetical protein
MKSLVDQDALATLNDSAIIYNGIVGNDELSDDYRPRLTLENGQTVITDPAEALALVNVVGGYEPLFVYVMVQDEEDGSWLSSPHMTTECARVLAISLLHVATELDAMSDLIEIAKNDPHSQYNAMRAE